MTDISINRLSNDNNVGNTSSKTSEYAKLKNEYEKFLRQAKKSDFANSPVLKEKELELILKLKEAATAEEISDDLPEILSREMALKADLNDGVIPISQHEIMYYKPVEKSADFVNISQTYTVYNDMVRNADDSTKEIIDSDLKIMSEAGIGLDVSINLLDVIKTTDAKTGSISINQDTFKKLMTIKKILSTSRSNEKNEHNSPINQVGVQKFSYGPSGSIIFKNGKAIYVSPAYEKSIESMKSEYEQSVSDEEDKLLYDFALKYTDDDGQLNSNYIRTLSQLRQVGVVRKELLEFVDMCTTDDGTINKEVFNTVAQLKKAGVLSGDIKLLMNSFLKDSEGNFDKDDVESAVALTKSVMSGEDVAFFLPAMRTGEEAKEYILNCANIFDSQNTMKLLYAVFDEEFVPDENAMDVVNSLLRNSAIADENGEINQNEFVNLAEHMIGVAKDFNTSSEVNEDAVAVIFQMCLNSFSPDDIEKLLGKCLDKNGKIDKNLAKILWHMTWNQNSVQRMNQVMDICSENDVIGIENAKNILKYLDEET